MDAKITLPESDLPRSWYNILADAPNPPQPPLHPGTGQPVGPDDLAPLFPMDLILRRSRPTRRDRVPEEVLDVLRLWRPTPLHRAHRLERAIATRSRIYYKYEGGSPVGLHIAEHRRRPGVLLGQGGPPARDRDGAGQWERARPRVGLRVGQGLHGARELRPEALPARDDGNLGRERRPQPVARRAPERILSRTRLAGQSRDRDLEAVEDAAGRDDTSYSLTRPEPRAPAPDGDRPGGPALRWLAGSADVVIGCVGGGSNFGGLALPFVRDKIAGAESTSSPASRRPARR
jgi:tryptophan synthase beta chain